MTAVLTMPYMAKPHESKSKSVTLSFRLSQDEADFIEQQADSQSVPVDRAALLAHIVRKWIRENQKPTPRPRRE